MAIEPGTKLGVYAILDPIGAGGMGEVYRARDTKLDRDVAIKVLPEEFAQDEERLARFEREAKLLASLNHPNIASIYGFEESDGVKALALELVEGPTLMEQIAQGPIPIEETITIAKQIAEALEAGHEAGVIHRDLKPANIKLKEDGTVKVLDYGLAKAIGGDAPSVADSELSQSPTLTRQGTQIGAILGTAAYMSPEQAAGRIVDRRSDIWAYGAVLFEMLTGRRLFTGDTTSHVLAEVLKSEIDLSELPDDTPSSIRRMVERCLRRDPKLRTPHMGGPRLDIEEALTPPANERLNPPAGDSRPRWSSMFAVSFVMLVAGAALASLLLESRSEPAAGGPLAMTRFIVPIHSTESGWTATKDIALAPDGRTLVFVVETEGVTQLYRRDMDKVAEAPIVGTNGARQPFFSPDGEWLAFEVDGEILRVPLEGGEPVRVGAAPSLMLGGAWTEDDQLLIGSFGKGLFRVPASGGDLEPLTRLRAERGEIGHVDPLVLPGGQVVLFTTGYGSQFDPTVDAFNLETAEYRHVASGLSAAFVKSDHLVVGHADGTLTAAPFDVVRAEVTGDTVTLGERVRGASSQMRRYAVSAGGTLAYISAGEVPAGFPAMWVDRVGQRTPVPQREAEYGVIGPRFSPDDVRVVGGTAAPGRDLWIFGVSDGSAMRLTFDPAPDIMPIWSPDGTFIVFESLRDEGGLYRKSADGSGTVQRVTSGPTRQIPYGWVTASDAAPGSGNGWSLLFGAFDTETGWDIKMMEWGAPESASFLLRTQADEFNAALSPDGRWLAYTSDESGREQVYVQPFPEMNGKWQVSRDGGLSPVWVKGGRELVFRSGSSWLAVAVDSASSFATGLPQHLFRDDNFIPFGGLILGRLTSGRNFAVSADGQRFLINRDPRSDAEAGGVEVVVVQNWITELRARVPTGN